MANVYHATVLGADGSHSPVVIKSIRPELAGKADMLRQFAQEASVGADLVHPNIVRVYDFLDHKGLFIMVLEYVAGIDLLTLIRTLRAARRVLDPEIVSLIALNVCRALERAHGYVDQTGKLAPVIHRDISPPNILISFDGHIKLADFGIARVLGSMRMTRAGILKGKYSYMSPEQSHGREVDNRSDLFSLGIVLWETASARRLFGGRTAKEKIMKIRNADIPHLSTVAPHCDLLFCDIVHRALQQNIDERFQTATEMRGALRTYLDKAKPVDESALSKILMACCPSEDPSLLVADPALAIQHGDELEPETDNAATILDMAPPVFRDVEGAGAHTLVLFDISRLTPPPRAPEPAMKSAGQRPSTLHATPVPRAAGAGTSGSEPEQFQGTLVGIPIATPTPTPYRPSFPSPPQSAVHSVYSAEPPRPDRKKRRKKPKPAPLPAGQNRANTERRQMILSLVIGIPVCILAAAIVFWLLSG